MLVAIKLLFFVAVWFVATILYDRNVTTVKGIGFSIFMGFIIASGVAIILISIFSIGGSGSGGRIGGRY